MRTNFSQTAAYIWSLADLLRGDFKQSQYGRVILPFTILRRLECVLEARKPKVLEQVTKLKAMPKVEEEAREKFLLRAAGQSFYNTSPMDLSKLGSSDIKSNLTTYVDSFSPDAREIFEHFRFDEFVGKLNEANLLFKVVQKVATTDLSPKAISNHDMGLVFEELIRRFAESSNETAGEHFTPRDIVRLTTSLVFMEDDDALTEEGIIRTIYDPTAGTGVYSCQAPKLGENPPPAPPFTKGEGPCLLPPIEKGGITAFQRPKIPSISSKRTISKCLTGQCLLPSCP